MICIIVGQRLGFDVFDYPKQNRQMYRHPGQLVDLVDIAAFSSIRDYLLTGRIDL